MILRRFTQHVRDQNWFAVGIDVVVVVGSVLLATQLSTAIDNRRARADLNSSMLNVHREFARSVKWTNSAIRYQKRIMAGLQDAVAILDGASPSQFNMQRVHRSIEEGSIPPVNGVWFSSLRELRDSGDLRRISDESAGPLLLEILAYAESQESNRNYRMRGAEGRPFDYPFIAVNIDRESTGSAWGMYSITNIDWAAARQDPEFRTALIHAHVRMAGNAFDMQATVALLSEAVSTLDRAGYGSSKDWMSENAERVLGDLDRWTGELDQESESEAEKR